MNEKTLVALKGSIEKWHNILHADGEDKGQANCPLCPLFAMAGSCKGCPVYEKAGLTHCQNTPWAEWATHQEEKHEYPVTRGYKIKCPDCQVLAQAEYDFLKDLLIDYLSTRAKMGIGCIPPYTEVTVEKEATYHCAVCGMKIGFGGYMCYTCATKSRVEKKEEWEDITKKITWVANSIISGYWLDGAYRGKEIVYFTGSEIIPNGELEIKIEVKKPVPDCRNEFRILKRV